MVQLALERLMAGRTVLIIAHRLATVRHADRIAVMEARSHRRRGHARRRCLGTNPLYARLAALQFGGRAMPRRAWTSDGRLRPDATRGSTMDRLPSTRSAGAPPQAVKCRLPAPAGYLAMLVTFPDSPYELHQPFEPAGDQPEAIAQAGRGHSATDSSFQTLLGVTGSGKTFTMANVIARTGRPALVLAPNKTLAAQLYSEFREFFPNNAVEYFVSLLRLLPARGLRSLARPLHREGQLDQRAHRADAAVGDEGDPRAAGLRDRGDGVGDLRHRRPVRVPQHDPAREAGRPRSRSATRSSG